MKVDGTIEKFKARLVIQGFRQKLEIDYFDTYALVAHISTIRLLIDLKLIHNLIIYQMDVKTTFLNSELDEEVYINNLGASLCMAMKISKFDESVGKLSRKWISSKKTENHSQTDKTEHCMEWKNCAKSRAKVQNAKSVVILKNQQSYRSQTEEYYWMQS
ncbi:zinc finger, CCHC-type containing protein [Tanacetum coccineum]